LIDAKIEAKLEAKKINQFGLELSQKKIGTTK